MEDEESILREKICGFNVLERRYVVCDPKSQTGVKRVKSYGRGHREPLPIAYNADIYGLFSIAYGIPDSS